MTERENILRAIRFEHPEYIPVRFCISADVFFNYEQAQLEDLLAAHPIVGGLDQMRYDLIERKKANQYNQKYRHFDEFGVEWEVALSGIRGVVQDHPLADFSKIRDYQMPELHLDLEKTKADIARQKEQGLFTRGGLAHGHTFLRLTDLCGYENVLLGMADEDEDLMLLMEKIEAYNAQIVDHYVKAGVDMVIYPEDLGMQVGPMISPSLFRQFIKPSYQRLMKPARDAGAIIQMHSDGDIRALTDDLVDSGVDILNMQDLVNGIDWIRDRFAGKTCVDLDIDRQKITVFGTPKDVDDLIREEVTKLSSPAGGLMMVFGWYTGTPIENIDALMTALEKYMYYWS